MKICRLKFKSSFLLFAFLVLGILSLANTARATEILFINTLSLALDNFCCGGGGDVQWMRFHTDVGSINSVSWYDTDSETNAYFIITEDISGDVVYSTETDKKSTSGGTLVNWTFDSVVLSPDLDYKISMYGWGASFYYQSSGTRPAGVLSWSWNGYPAPNIGLGYDDTWSAVPPLEILTSSFDDITGILSLSGTCGQNGSGVYQMKLVGLADNATTSQPVLPDPLGVDRGMLVDCIDNAWSAEYAGGGLTGVHYIAIDDTFYGTEWSTTQQDFTQQAVSNGFNNIIFPRNQPTLGSLLEDTNTVFYYSYNTRMISNTIFGALAYLEIARCTNISCDATSSVPEFFVDYTGATSTKSYVLGKGITYATSTDTPGQSFFTLPAPTDRLGTSTTVSERYRVTPYYFNSVNLSMYKANPVVFLVTWQNGYDTFNGVPQELPCVSVELDEDKLCTEETVMCSIRNGLTIAIFWLTSPNCSSLNYFQSGYSAIKSGFPFNAYFDVADAINTAIDSATSTATTTIGVPFIERISSTSSKFVILPVISSTTIPNAIGATNANTVRTTIAFVIWIFSALFVFFIVQKV